MPSLLVIEDDPLVRDTLVRTLRPLYDVHEASSVAAALAALRQSTPDVVVLDLCLDREATALHDALSRRVRTYLGDLTKDGLELKRGRRPGAKAGDAARSQKVTETINAVFAARKILREQGLEGRDLDRAAREKVARETGIPLQKVVRRWRQRGTR